MSIICPKDLPGCSSVAWEAFVFIESEDSPDKEEEEQADVFARDLLNNAQTGIQAGNFAQAQSSCESLRHGYRHCMDHMRREMLNRTETAPCLYERKAEPSMTLSS